MSKLKKKLPIVNTSYFYNHKLVAKISIFDIILRYQFGDLLCNIDITYYSSEFIELDIIK